MAKKREKSKKPAGFTKGVLRLLILLVTSLLIFAALVLPELISQSNIPTGVGEASAQEILAPYSITYESKVLTERARMQANIPTTAHQRRTVSCSSIIIITEVIP